MKNFHLATTFAFMALLSSAGAARAADDRAVVESFYKLLLSGTTRADLEQRMDEVLSPAWESHGGYGQPAKTRAQFLKQLEQTGTVVPDLVWNVEEVLQDGNRFVVRGRATATPVRAFLGVEPSGRRFEIMSIDIHTVENHKIVTSYHVEDWHAAITQLQGQ